MELIPAPGRMPTLASMRLACTACVFFACKFMTAPAGELPAAATGPCSAPCMMARGFFGPGAGAGPAAAHARPACKHTNMCAPAWDSWWQEQRRACAQAQLARSDMHACMQGSLQDGCCLLRLALKAMGALRGGGGAQQLQRHRSADMPAPHVHAGSVQAQRRQHPFQHALCWACRAGMPI